MFGDCCVAIYCFCSGYGLFITYKNDVINYNKKNLIRLIKLYINYWIVLFIFVVILGNLLGKSNDYPGGLKKFVLSFTAIDPAYNGAWWFLTTYIILVLLSPFIIKLVIKYNNKIILIISFIFYFFAYIQRIKGVISFDSDLFNYIIRQISLFGTSQLPFIIGTIFAHRKIYSKLYNYINKFKNKNLICIIIILFMIVFHGFIQTLFVAVFTGVVFICAFNLMNIPIFMKNIFLYLSNHSTNLWLVHMFFTSIFFKKITFMPKYSFLIFVWLIILCLIASYVINFIYNIILKFMNKITIFKIKDV